MTRCTEEKVVVLMAGPSPGPLARIAPVKCVSDSLHASVSNRRTPGTAGCWNTAISLLVEEAELPSTWIILARPDDASLVSGWGLPADADVVVERCTDGAERVRAMRLGVALSSGMADESSTDPRATWLTRIREVCDYDRMFTREPIVCAPAPEPLVPDVPEDPRPGAFPRPVDGVRVPLVAGIIADTARLGTIERLVGDLCDIRHREPVSKTTIVLLENGNKPAPRHFVDGLRKRARESRVELVWHSMAAQRRDAETGRFGAPLRVAARRVGIGRARTMLQAYVYDASLRQRRPIVWILDDDMRLDPLVRRRDGGLERRQMPFIGRLLGLRAQGVHAVLGPYTGAAPLPFAATMRVQLVDLQANLCWLNGLRPGDALPDRHAQNARQEEQRRDFYYDLSCAEFDRLETPWWWTPSHKGEAAGDALSRLLARAPRMLAGEQVFRPLNLRLPLAWDAEPCIRRGGNTFILDPEILRDVPNAIPDFAGREARRSDMVWSLLQVHHRGRRIVSAPIGVFHDRSDLPIAGMDIGRTVDDIRGFALYQTLAARSSRDSGPLGPADVRDVRIFARHLRGRLTSIELSFARALGLIAPIRTQLDRLAVLRPDLAPAANDLAALLGDAFRPDIMAQIRSLALQTDTGQVDSFFDDLRTRVRDFEVANADRRHTGSTPITRLRDSSRRGEL